MATTRSSGAEHVSRRDPLLEVTELDEIFQALDRALDRLRLAEFLVEVLVDRLCRAELDLHDVCGRPDGDDSTSEVSDAIDRLDDAIHDLRSRTFDAPTHIPSPDRPADLR